MRQIAALTTRIERLQRAEAATLRAARYATVSLHLATPAPVVPKHHGHGPLHGLGVAFRWIGIGAVYGLALGVPALVLARPRLARACAPSGAAARTRCSAGLELSEHPERRLAERPAR